MDEKLTFALNPPFLVLQHFISQNHDQGRTFCNDIYQCHWGNANE
jgi:hypothetical protein